VATLAAAGLWAAVALSPRALEYAVPLTAVVAGLLVARAPRRRLAALLLALAATLTQVPAVTARARQPAPPPVRTREALAAVEALPGGTAGALVFTCEWHAGAFVLYRRPDLRVLDVLDPRLLARAAPPLLDARLALNAGRAADPVGVLRGVFGARHVLCEAPAVTRALDADPDARRLHPPAGAPRPAAGVATMQAFELAAGRAPAYVRRFETAPVPAPAAPGSPPAPVPDVPWTAAPALPEPAVRLDLPAAVRDGSVACHAVRPAAGEADRLAGATLVGVGGSGRLWLWAGDTLLLAGWAPAAPGPVALLVPRPPPRGPAAPLAAVVCPAAAGPGGAVAVPGARDAGAAGATAAGLALSLWRPEALAAACAWKGRPVEAPAAGGGARYAAAAPATCLAPLALPVPGPGAVSAAGEDAARPRGPR
jgi:hypothetical protein